MAHTPKTSHWEDSVHFVVRPQCNSLSNHQGGNSYKFENFQPLEEFVIRPPLVVVRPRWNRGWRCDRPLVAVRPPGPALATYNFFFNEIILQGFQRFKTIRSKERNSGAHLKFSQE
jgi:hypothetical protein